jgi:hypothetical protein
VTGATIGLVGVAVVGEVVNMIGLKVGDSVGTSGWLPVGKIVARGVGKGVGNDISVVGAIVSE